MDGPSTSEVPATACPQCRSEIDMATEIVAGQVSPREGDFTVCLYCGEILRFGPALELLKTSVFDLFNPNLPAYWRGKLMQLSAHLKRRRRRN